VRALPLDAAFNRALARERVNLLELLIADACCCSWGLQVHRFLLEERQLSGTLAAKTRLFALSRGIFPSLFFRRGELIMVFLVSPRLPSAGLPEI